MIVFMVLKSKKHTDFVGTSTEIYRWMDDISTP